MAGKKQKFDPAKHCGGGRAKACKNAKGFRTTHPGRGKCWKHGGIQKDGDRRLKHGLYSDIGSDSLRAALAKVRASEKDRLDLTEEVDLLRALTIDYVDRFEKFKDQLARFDTSFAPALQTIIMETDPKKIAEAVTLLKQQIVHRPKSMLDISNASLLVERLGRMIERVHTIRKTSTITLEVFVALQERMALIMMKYVKEGTEGKKTPREIIEAITAGWNDIDVPEGNLGRRSSSED